MKKLLLFMFLCLSGLFAKAQTIQYYNTRPCPVSILYKAINPTTCLVMATDGPHVIPPTPISPPSFYTLSWAPPTTFIPIAEVSYNCPGASSIEVGGGACTLGILVTIPAACGCTPGTVRFPTGPVNVPIPPGLMFPLNIY